MEFKNEPTATGEEVRRRGKALTDFVCTREGGGEDGWEPPPLSEILVPPRGGGDWGSGVRAAVGAWHSIECAPPTDQSDTLNDAGIDGTGQAISFVSLCRKQLNKHQLRVDNGCTSLKAPKQALIDPKDRKCRPPPGG